MQLLNRLRERVTPEESVGSDTTSIPPTVMYEIMQNERRLRIVEFLVSTDSDSVSVAELADHMASEYPGEERQRAYISAIQNHLPVMAEFGSAEIKLIDYDADRKTVSPQPAVDRVWRAHRQVKEELG